MNLALDIAIAPLAAEWIESLRRGVDLVARERKYFDIVEAAPAEHFREYLLNQIANHDPFFVAIAQEEVIGWCEVERRKGVEAHSGLLNVAIVPGFRGRGLGRKLVTFALEEARQTGFVRIDLWVHADNARAIALYEKLGFAKEGLLRSTGAIDGKFYDSAIMALLF